MQAVATMPPSLPREEAGIVRKKVIYQFLMVRSHQVVEREIYQRIGVWVKRNHRPNNSTLKQTEMEVIMLIVIRHQ